MQSVRTGCHLHDQGGRAGVRPALPRRVCGGSDDPEHGNHCGRPLGPVPLAQQQHCPPGVV